MSKTVTFCSQELRLQIIDVFKHVNVKLQVTTINTITKLANVKQCVWAKIQPHDIKYRAIFRCLWMTLNAAIDRWHCVPVAFRVSVSVSMWSSRSFREHNLFPCSVVWVPPVERSATAQNQAWLCASLWPSHAARQTANPRHRWSAHSDADDELGTWCNSCTAEPAWPSTGNSYLSNDTLNALYKTTTKIKISLNFVKYLFPVVSSYFCSAECVCIQQYRNMT